MALFVVAGGSLGCRLVSESADPVKSLLQPAVASSDSVTLEIFFVKFSLGDSALYDSLWYAVDEQQLKSDLRRRLAENGFRAGVVGTQIPDTLAQVLRLSEKGLTDEEKSRGVVLDEEPSVRKRLLQLRFGKRGEIVASPVQPVFPLLMADEGVVEGKTFHDAQGQFAIEVAQSEGPGIMLSLLPEIHHGKPQQRWAGRDGIMRLTMSRPKKIFDQLQIESSLRAGEMLLLSCIPDASGSLGFRFFTEDTVDERFQKLLLVRIAETPRRETFAPE